MLNNFLLTLFLVLLYMPNLGAQVDHVRLESEIQKIIRFDTEITHAKTPGFIIGIIDNDFADVLSFGSKHINFQKPLDANDIFEIGSLTKIFTALVMFRLEAEGILSLNQNVNDFLPQAYRNDKLNGILISDLLSHISGLPKLPLGLGYKEKESGQPYKYFSKQDLLQFYAQIDTTEKGKYLYSHFTYALLEVIIEEATGQHYDSVLEKYMGQPMALKNTAIQPHATLCSGFDLTMSTVDPWSYQTFASAVGLKSNLNDLMSFVSHVFNEKNEDIHDAFMLSIMPKANTTYDKNLKVGSPWIIQETKKSGNIMMHSGKTAGHHSYIGICYETKTAVIVLSNSAYGTADLGYLILRMLNKNWKRKKGNGKE